MIHRDGTIYCAGVNSLAPQSYMLTSVTAGSAYLFGNWYFGAKVSRPTCELACDVPAGFESLRYPHPFRYMRWQP